MEEQSAEGLPAPDGCGGRGHRRRLGRWQGCSIGIRLPEDDKVLTMEPEVGRLLAQTSIYLVGGGGVQKPS